MEYLSAAVFSPQFEEIKGVIDESQTLSKSRGGIVHQAAYASAGTIIGGTLAGPFGALVGGMAGAIIGFAFVKTYNTILSVLGEMAEEERREFMRKIRLLMSGSIQEKVFKSVTYMTSSVTSSISTTTVTVAGNVLSAAGTVVSMPTTVTSYVYKTTISLTAKVGSALTESVPSFWKRNR